MKAIYDDELISVTERFISAVKELMAAECEMMAAAHPDYPDDYTWGICRIKDLARVGALDLQYGGDEDKPRGMTEKFMVVSII